MFHNECASRARIFEWARRFKEGRKSVCDDERLGTPVTVTTNANVNRLRALLTTNCHLRTQILSVELGIHRETVHQLLHNKLHMRKLCVKLVPNALGHSSLTVREYLMEKIFPHCHTHLTAPNSPPVTFFLFAKLRSILKGTRFDDLEEIKANTIRVLKASTSSDFKLCLKAWERRWNKCVILGSGDYCEGIEVHFV